MLDLWHGDEPHRVSAGLTIGVADLHIAIDTGIKAIDAMQYPTTTDGFLVDDFYD